MGECRFCKERKADISGALGVCLSCIRSKPHTVLPDVREAHRKLREDFGLPAEPPRDPEGVSCGICVHECRIPGEGRGYCGLRTNTGGRLRGVTPEEGKLSWYHDPLPTNCVADWVCPGGTGAGYPRFAVRNGPEYGHTNLAVFYHACTFDCLSCQNWHYREETLRRGTSAVDDLLAAVDGRTACICHFGGDPTPQLPFAIRASRRAVEEHREKILRICWETNGSMHRGYLDQMVGLSLETGGCIKFDLKAWDEHVHLALTGATNRRTLENFRRAGERVTERSVPPLLVANTLLVPGYIDEEEIRGIARFIVSVSPDIPYSMLAFSPHFRMADLPYTGGAFAERCARIAREEGIRTVRIGNRHLLR